MPYATQVLLHLFPSERERDGSDHTTGPRLSDCRTDFGESVFPWKRGKSIILPSVKYSYTTFVSINFVFILFFLY